MSKEAMKLARQIIWRYRHETPLGNQPHMIAHEADEAIERIDQALAKQEQGGWHTHDLYTDADKDRPDVICDSNGQVALGLCKRCGRGEAELETPCDKPKRCEYCKRGLKTMCLCGLNPKQEQGEPVAWRVKVDVKLSDGKVSTTYQLRNTKLSEFDEPLYTTPQQRPSRSDIKPMTDEQAAFESVFKLPANCTKFAGGYAPTSYNAWGAQLFCDRWEGWKARAAHGITASEAEDSARSKT